MPINVLMYKFTTLTLPIILRKRCNITVACNIPCSKLQQSLINLSHSLCRREVFVLWATLSHVLHPDLVAPATDTRDTWTLWCFCCLQKSQNNIKGSWHFTFLFNNKHRSCCRDIWSSGVETETKKLTPRSRDWYLCEDLAASMNGWIL